MAFVDSRLGPGTLTIGTPGTEHSTQISALALTPAVDETDGTPTLALPTRRPSSTKWTLDGSAINDLLPSPGCSGIAMTMTGKP
jgi:hypothetical protein